MRLLIQRVKEASVTVDEKITGQIREGLLLFLGVHKDDTPDKIEWLVNKVIGMRIFGDDADKMNLNITQANGNILIVSQFTLYADLNGGRRPAFTEAAPPEQAEAYYQSFIGQLKAALGRPIQTGIFGARMEVSLINDGPVTFLLER